uniref:Uncharacterized protein n=1 Tax=Loa loa TaxID=7209 RepID=A0A1I7W1C4_LOALO
MSHRFQANVSSRWSTTQMPSSSKQPLRKRFARSATVCCWHNQVDYFCCLDVAPLDCPDYHNVTVVVHNANPQNPFALRSFHFREGIEDEIAAMTKELIRDNTVREEKEVLVRHNNARN